MSYGSGVVPPAPPRVCKTEGCARPILRGERAGRPPDYCPECRDARAAPKRSTQRLECVCWCEEQTKHIPADEVRAGRTVSCGAPGCQP